MRVTRALSLHVAAMLLALAPVVVPGRAHAQDIRVRLVVAAPHSSSMVQGIADEVDGVAGGLAVDLRAGALSFSASGVRGSLEPAPAASALSRDFGDVTLGARYRVRSWLEVGAHYTARAFSSPAGHARWDIVGVGATASRELGTPRAVASITAAYLPSVALSTEEAGTGLSSELAVSLEPALLPVHVRLHYAIERFLGIDPDRAEQFESFAIAVGVRLRRVDGRWTLGP